MKALRLSLMLLALIPLTAVAERPGTLTPDEARQVAERDQVIMVDVRQPEEWRETGVAPGVELIPMRHPDGEAGLLADFRALVGEDLDQPLLLICRTGNRSAQVQAFLEHHGFSNVTNVSEGMVGSDTGPGWIARGLAVEPCERC